MRPMQTARVNIVRTEWMATDRRIDGSEFITFLGSSLDRVGDHSSTEVKCCGNLRHSPPCSAGGSRRRRQGGY